LEASKEYITPSLDSCHFQGVRALQKAGWLVNNKPMLLDIDLPITIDISATKATNGGASQNRRVLIEVKCLPGHDRSQELYIAFGQYVFCRAALSDQQVDAPLYLALPTTIHYGRFGSIGSLPKYSWWVW
jgi:hypothetical protein